MKKTFTLFILILVFGIVQSIFAQPWYVRGGFNGWAGTADQLVDDGTLGDVTPGDGIYSRLITIPTAGRDEWKVTLDDWSVNYPVSGNSWYYTTINNQEVLFTYDSNTYGDGWLPDVNIVNADDQPTNDFVAVGDHNGWNNSGSEIMHDDGLDGDWLAGDGIYAYHAIIASPGSYNWKAVIYGTWDAWGSDNRSNNADNVGYTTVSADEDVYFYLDLNTGRLFTSSSPLPVELVSFNANVSGTIVNLQWKTATELNNSGFAVERKIDDNWLQIGFVEGYGTTTKPQNYSFADQLSNISASKVYYRLKQIDFDGTFEYSDVVDVDVVPVEFTLNQNYPNPFNPSTKITYSLAGKTFVALKVYDAIGNEVVTLVNKEQTAGNYEIQFNALNLTSGVYFYKMNAGNFSAVKKMLLVK
ncbi:hypothetical protein BMS3Abin03_01392 [bacterium BMS3Abin03]|nr:hypothetical protein BMS3Abin03_01392 [bacterium BMS3Abin03]